MAFLKEMRSEHKKDCMFDNVEFPVSYPTGIPILDQRLGSKYSVMLSNGEYKTEYRLGLPCATHTMLFGPSQSFKTTTAVQIAWNVTSRFGEDSIVVHCDVERSYTMKRIKDVTGATSEELDNKYVLRQNINNVDEILGIIVEIAEKKLKEPERYMYDTKQVDYMGKPIHMMIPTFVIVDSLPSLVGATTDTSEIGSITNGMREAIEKGRFYRNSLEYMGKANINVITINHMGVAMSMPGSPARKQLPFMPGNAAVPGGEKPLYYSSTVIGIIPNNSKTEIKTKELNGYNGHTLKFLGSKCRTNHAGWTASVESTAEGGVNPTLTLMELAKSKDVIKGRNPGSYFESYPDVKFDTRKFLDETASNPEIMRCLYKEMKPVLMEMISAIDDVDDSDPVNSSTLKNKVRDMLYAELYEM